MLLPVKVFSERAQPLFVTTGGLILEMSIFVRNDAQSITIRNSRLQDQKTEIFHRTRLLVRPLLSHNSKHRWCDHVGPFKVSRWRWMKFVARHQTRV